MDLVDGEAVFAVVVEVGGGVVAAVGAGLGAQGGEVEDDGVDVGVAEDLGEGGFAGGVGLWGVRVRRGRWTPLEPMTPRRVHVGAVVEVEVDVRVFGVVVAADGDGGAGEDLAVVGGGDVVADQE